MGRELPVLLEMQSGFLSIGPRGGSHHLLGDLSFTEGCVCSCP